MTEPGGKGDSMVALEEQEYLMEQAARHLLVLVVGGFSGLAIVVLGNQISAWLMYAGGVLYLFVGAVGSIGWMRAADSLRRRIASRYERSGSRAGLLDRLFWMNRTVGFMVFLLITSISILVFAW